MLHSCPFILLSCPFMFRRCVSKIQVFENWYAKTILNRSGGYPPKRSCFFIFRYRFCYRLAIGLEARAGCHLQVSWTCACISSWSFFYSYRFLGRQCVGSVKLQAKLKWNAPGYYTVPFFLREVAFVRTVCEEAFCNTKWVAFCRGSSKGDVKSHFLCVCQIKSQCVGE